MSRLFIAVVPGEFHDNRELKQLIIKFKRTINDRNQEARWTPPDLWHVTMQFLGDVPVNQATDAFSAMTLSNQNLELRIQGVGAFPEEHAARVLWFGIQKNQGLLDLQSELTARLSEFGLPVDSREFKPHLTLVRFRNSISVADLVKLGGRKYFGDYPIKELILFESVSQGNMSKYIPIARRTITSEPTI